VGHGVMYAADRGVGLSVCEWRVWLFRRGGGCSGMEKICSRGVGLSVCEWVVWLITGLFRHG
jgi:hypothetical protein